MNENKVLFDLSPDGEYCEGFLSFDGNKLTAEQNGTLREYPFQGIEEAVQITDVGCGRLELRPKDGRKDGSDNIPVCFFSMSCVAEVGELVKVMNHFIRTGESLCMNNSDIPVCPKCHRHYIKGMKVCLFCVKKGYVFKRAFTYFKPYAAKVFLAGILLTVANVLNAVIPFFNSLLIDNYFLPTEDTKPLFEDTSTGIIVTVLSMFGIFVISQVTSVFSTRLSNRIGSRFSNDLRRIIYEKIQSLSLSSMSHRATGNLIHRVTRDTEKIKDFFNDQGKYLIEQIIMFLVVLGILLRTNVILTLVVFIPVPIGLVLMRLFNKSVHRRYDRQWRVDSKATSILHDIIKGIRVVKSFGNEEREIAKFSKVSKDLATVSASNEKFWAVTFPVIGNVMAFGEFFVLLIGGKMVLDGKLTVGELTRFTLYLTYIYSPMRWMSMFPRRLADASTSLVKLYEIIDEPLKMEDVQAPVPFDGTGAIEFKHVDFGYKSYEPVLKDINLKIEPGEMVGLVGHSGAGKSTLINLCMRLYDPTVGSVTIGGVDLKNMSQQSLREQIGVVFQETYLFSGSVFDNIAYARPEASPEEIIAAAKAAKAHEFIVKLPDGYNTVIGENGHTLSGGERQRISIARAILKNPKILILDEATSSLDPETELKIQEALQNLTQGRTTIAIAHRLATLRNADKLAVLEKGHIVQFGSHEELMQEEGIYQNLVLAQRQTAKLK